MPLSRTWLTGVGLTILLLVFLGVTAFDGPALGQNEKQAQPKNGTKKQGQRKQAARKKAEDEFATPGASQADVSRQEFIAPGSPASSYEQLLIQDAVTGGAQVLSVGDSFDDFVSVAQDSAGTVYVAYAAYYNGHDQIRLHRRNENNEWSTFSPVPLAGHRADIWMPQIAVDGNDHLWVIWAEQTGQTPGNSGNWDLYARQRLATAWGPLVRLTNDPKPDINHHVARDTSGNLHVVWQAHPENSGDVQYCSFNGKEWSKPLAVTSDEESDWYPRVAVDHSGTAWIVFDSYRNGDYDVFLTSVANGTPGQVIPIATSTFYEAHASVACTRDGRVWISWEQGGHNWGKNQGHWTRLESRNQGTTLGSGREVRVACWKNGELRSAPDLAAVMPKNRNGAVLPYAMAELSTSAADRVWLRFRHLAIGRQRAGNRFTRGWTEKVSWLSKDGWAEPVEMPASYGRISVFSRILPAKDGGLLVAYSGDARNVQNFHQPIHDTAMFRQLPAPDSEPGAPELELYDPPEPPAGIAAWNSNLEDKQVQAIRDHRVNIDGVEHRIVRGDLHRHTELSWDVGPGNDGSFLDFYRYMIDVAEMDFGGLTDHQGGGGYAYWWWLSEKSCDMYYLAPRFVPLYGYERSAKFPNGHRNIFHSYRGVPVFQFQLTLDQKGVFPGVGSGALVDNDTKLLYEYLHGSRGIAISHTSGTSTMGTDWRDNDPEIEPVVEIYQGARNSYETLGGPRVHPEDEPPARAPGGFQQEGLLWNAYKKGYRLGTIASSDHGSTHISYALVYTPENERQPIIDSIKKRHTWGATENIILELFTGDGFMGDELTVDGKPSLLIRALGTEPITELTLVRNNEYVYTSKPGKQTVEFKWTDMTPSDDVNLYYFRVVQADGEVAWSSPVWIHVSK